MNLGGTIYDAWYELYPAGAEPIPYQIKPSDIITASLQFDWLARETAS